MSAPIIIAVVLIGAIAYTALAGVAFRLLNEPCAKQVSLRGSMIECVGSNTFDPSHQCQPCNDRASGLVYFKTALWPGVALAWLAIGIGYAVWLPFRATFRMCAGLIERGDHK